MDETTIYIEDLEDEIKGYIEKINEDIGFYWWKRYIYSAFWSNISTPINLAIVVFTAITTGQTATKNLVSEEVSTLLGSTVLFVSIFNTFFRPNEQLAQNQKIMQDWAEIGEQFDEIYYDRVYTKEEKIVRLNNLEKLFKSMSSLKRTNDSNYFIDLIYLIARVLCIRSKINWIKIDNTIIENRARRRTMAISSGAGSTMNNMNNANPANTPISVQPSLVPESHSIQDESHHIHTNVHANTNSSEI